MTSRRSRNFADYARAARRRKLILFLPGMVFALAAAAALRELPGLFGPKARLRVTTTKATPSEASVQLNVFRKQLTAHDVLEEVVSEMGPGPEPSEAIVVQLRGRIAIEPETDPEAPPGAFNVSCRATDPEAARRLTQALVNRLAPLRSNQPEAQDSATAGLRKRAADSFIPLRNPEAKDPWLTEENAYPRSGETVIVHGQPVQDNDQEIAWLV